MGVRIMASSASLGCGEIESLEPPIKRTRRSDSPNLTSSEGLGTFKGSSDGPTTSQDDTGGTWYLPSSEKSAENSFQYQGGTSTIASSEENDLDREAAGDSGFSDGMATPPTSNCDDVSQDSSGAFSFNQNINSSTNTSISKATNESRHRNGCSTNYKDSSPFSFSNNLSIRQGSPKQSDQPERQSSTEDEEKPLVPIDPSDLKYLFGADSTSQYHDGLTDSEAGSTSSESFDGDTNQMRHSTNSERSPEPGTSHSSGASGENNRLLGSNEDQNGDDDDDDRLSCISGISELSGAEWKPTAGPFAWVQNQMMRGTDPRDLLKDMISADSVIPDHLDQLTLWKIVLNMVAEPPRRKKLPDVNTLEDVARLIRSSKKIIVLTSAGVSVSCGIPDFRSRDGVYARLAVDFPDLPDPQAMFDIHYFRKDPRPFFKFAKEIYPGQFEPSPCHKFIKSVENHGKLLRNYTQNIDTLEQVVGISNVVQCHGSFATATCTKPSCRAKVVADEIKKDIFDQRIPYCQICSKDYKEPTEDEKSNPSLSNDDDKSPSDEPECKDDTKSSETSSISPLNALPDPGSSSNNLSTSSATDPSGSSSHDANPSEETPCMPKTLPPEQPGIMKPDIVFFGEGLGDEFHKSVAVDKNEVDLLIMIGSSLKVRPVALIPSSIAPEVPQILINREPLSHLTPDVELLGDCDGIINQICSMLGEDWQEPVHTTTLSESHELLPDESDDEDDEIVAASKPKSENENTEQKVQINQSTSDNSIGENPTDASNNENEKSG